MADESDENEKGFRSKKKGKRITAGEKEIKPSKELGVGLGGILSGVGELLGSVQELQEKAGEIEEKSGAMKKKEFELNGKKGVIGYSFNVRPVKGEGGIRGRPQLRKFGSVEKTPKGVKIKKSREPLVDYWEENGSIRVTAELPGIKEEDLNLGLEGKKLLISASSDERSYEKEIELPASAKAISKKSCKNGVLDLTLTKEEES